MEEINIKELFAYIKKYLFIIIIVAVVLVAEIIFYDKKIKTPLYKASTTVVLTQTGDAASTGNSIITQNDININQKLVSTYTEIVKSKLVLEQVIEDLNLKESYGGLYGKVSVQAVTNTEILRISVEHKDKDLTAEIANKIATVFSKEVGKIYKLNNISIIDKAQVPTSVSNNTLKRDVVLAFAIGIFLSIAVIFVIYYFDDTIKLTEDIEEKMGMPLVGRVFKSDLKTKNKELKNELLLEKYPKSVVSESIKTLRTNLQFSTVDNDFKTILITSSIPGEGKSFISSNLAIAFTQTGKKVLLIDCDLRKGRQHKIFKVPNLKGLSNLLIDDVDKYEKYINKTHIDKLSIITRGTVPPNPSELLNSKKNKKLIEKLKNDFDIIIFDATPCNGLPDAIIMSKLVDQVLVVSREGFTPKEAFESTKNALNKVEAPIAGTILNHINKKSSSYGKYYSYYGDMDK